MSYELRKCIGCDEYVPMQYDDLCDDCSMQVDQENEKIGDHCATCGKDISHKIGNPKYCSATCARNNN